MALKRAKTESHLDDLKAIGFVRDINALPMSLYHPDSQPASADTQEETKVTDSLKRFKVSRHPV